MQVWFSVSLIFLSLFRVVCVGGGCVVLLEEEMEATGPASMETNDEAVEACEQSIGDKAHGKRLIITMAMVL